MERDRYLAIHWVDFIAAIFARCSISVMGIEGQTEINDWIIDCGLDGDPNRGIAEWRRSMGQSQIPGCVYQLAGRISGLGMVCTEREQESLVVADGAWFGNHPGLVCPLVPATQ